MNRTNSKMRDQCEASGEKGKRVRGKGQRKNMRARTRCLSLFTPNPSHLPFPRLPFHLFRFPYPAAFPEQQEHSDRDEDHNSPNRIVAVARVKLRHVFEVHAVNMPELHSRYGYYTVWGI